MREASAILEEKKAPAGKRGGGGPMRFAWVVLLFFAPLLIFGALVEGIFWAAGETWPINKVIAAQREQKNSLFMRGVIDQAFYQYKFRNITLKQPEILVLGSSRVMEFREEMFGRSGFYNAGGMIQGLHDLEWFFGNIPSNRAPRVVILGIDLWWLSSKHQPGSELRSSRAQDAAADWQAHLKAIRRFKSSKVYKPAIKAVKARNDHIGIQARTTTAGFRGDGSMQYHFAVPETDADWKFVDRENPPIPERIEKGVAPFQPNDGVDPGRLKILADVLAELKRHNILVLGFLPPFSSNAAALMESNEGQARLWTEGRAAVRELFENNQHAFVDASTTGSLGLDDRSLIDGIHAAETFHLHLLRRFLETPRVRAEFPELNERLDRLLESNRTDFWHPDYAAAGQPE